MDGQQPDVVEPNELDAETKTYFESAGETLPSAAGDQPQAGDPALPSRNEGSIQSLTGSSHSECYEPRGPNRIVAAATMAIAPPATSQMSGRCPSASHSQSSDATM